MKVTEVERKESTKHCCGNGWTQKNSAEHEGYAGALIGKRIAENNTTNADRGVKWITGKNCRSRKSESRV